MADSLKAVVGIDGLSGLDTASPSPKVGIGDSGSLSNTHNEVLIPSEGGVIEAGVPSSFPSLGEADGVDAGGDGGSPSLDNYRPSSNKPSPQSWDKKQKRGYHRIQSCLQYWQGNGYQVLWIMLSTAVDGDASLLAYHHQILRQRVERKLGYAGLQHYQVRTSEGNGVLHALWAWRADNGFRQRSFYVKQDWLSAQWQDIHNAPIVWICRVRRGRGSVNGLSRYCMAQYVGGQSGYEYMSWSWGRTFGFPLVACWSACKRLWSRYNGKGRKRALYRFWAAFLAGGYFPSPFEWFNMAMVTSKYRQWGSLAWQGF